ncbi:hypothetical protein YO5_15520 [Stutzerimonas stutzeri TS44]|nr:hypothetical protein YO5_15520 [Stutzerimonas stutzeri TS44]
MRAQSCKFDKNSASLIARNINEDGYACISEFLSAPQLEQLRTQLAIDAERHAGNYFAYHGDNALAGSLLVALKAAPDFQTMLADVYRQAAGNNAPSSEIFPVLRCVQGGSGRRESNCFHFDASLVTALLPIEIPQQGNPNERGDLLLFANRRRVRPSVLLNVVEKALVQNTFTRKLISLGIRLRLLRPQRLCLVPGNLYLFWGYRSLHANEPCNPAYRRATAIFHYGDPHAGSLLTSLILAVNQHRARRASQINDQHAI